MQKRTSATKYARQKKGKKTKSSAANRPISVLTPMDRLEASHKEWQEEMRRNPPHTEYVLPGGKMLPVPPILLKSKRGILDTYKSLHYFCANSVAPYNAIYHDHAHPIDCLLFMFAYGCISLDEMRAILEIPIQIRLLHEHLFRTSLLEYFPHRQFIVEFVELLRFILILHGRGVRDPCGIQRYCHCWVPWNPVKAKGHMPSDERANAYEHSLLRDRSFLKESKDIILSIPAHRWSYCKYQDWFLAYDRSYDMDLSITEAAMSGWSPVNRERPDATETGVPGMAKALRAFCDKWALTHIGTPFTSRVGHPISFRAERVEVLPRPIGDSPVPELLPPIGFIVHLPKYYGYSSIARGQKDDFVQLKYAMDMVKNQRNGIAELSESDKITLLRTLRVMLKRNGLPGETIYRILKGLTPVVSDNTMKKWRIAPPMMMPLKHIKNGQIVPMGLDEAFDLVMRKTEHRPDDRMVWASVLSRFGFELDKLSLNARYLFR